MALVVPSGAISAIITVETQPVRFRGDGTNPTNLIGHLLQPGAIFNTAGFDLRTLKFIETAASASMRYSFIFE